ncbi:thiamine biosynthesis lipoprotein [Methylobacterium brachiatum]|uniref:FAD:protein FMN transferase n=1 Tax=Methylobacterium brachiatum TaxID=269660 RepID=A0AAJ1TZW2_9HYPH|nr:FAD:protein FMN transferase [Methylobacterium brachiatum]MCB4805562.1 FAD:protein FMN transferase [Methylobacterium brachiatum]MDQ0546788.1 thiamine biosynthesis lipoprotein [Methylobacterium brachiatum]
MGTTWSVRLAGAHGRTASLGAAIAVLLDRLVMDLSHWEPASALCRFNRSPSGTLHSLPGALREVLEAALAIAEETSGAFDPTLGALVDLWGFGPQGPVPVPPDPEALAQAASCCGWQKLRFDRTRGDAWQPGGLSLDLSGIAKGYAVDRVSALLIERGVPDHLVEIGGELRGSGLKPDGSPWWGAMESPDATVPEMVAALHGLAVATSGEYRRCFVNAGRHFGHTLDPHRAEPIDTGLLAVSVLHSSCMLADAYATALLALGLERGSRLATRANLSARFLSKRCPQSVEVLSPSLRAMLD